MSAKVHPSLFRTALLQTATRDAPRTALLQTATRDAPRTATRNATHTGTRIGRAVLVALASVALVACAGLSGTPRSPTSGPAPVFRPAPGDPNARAPAGMPRASPPAAAGSIEGLAPPMGTARVPAQTAPLNGSAAIPPLTPAVPQAVTPGSSPPPGATQPVPIMPGAGTTQEENGAAPPGAAAQGDGAAPAGMPVPPVPLVRPPGAPDIALVLPLDSPVFARAAAAVRDGFLAAATAAGAADRCTVIAHGGDGVIGAFDAARARGARLIVGPLVRDDLKTVAIAQGTWPVAIALNQLDDGTRLPDSMYSLALAVESDARVLAERARSDGARTLAVIEGDKPLVRRLAVAFTGDWVGSGAPVPTGYVLDAGATALAELRRSVVAAAPDAALLALDDVQAAQVKPFLGPVAAYASGLLFERPPPAAARDLDGVRVTEIPWILTPDAPRFAGLPRQAFASDAEMRLYALGLDAFRVAQAFLAGVPERFAFDGAIGSLVLRPDHVFERTPALGEYRAGELVPLDGGH